jgi:hypothetical protein
MNRLLQILLVLFCFELGVLLIIVPWTSFWERNALLDRFPELRPAMTNHYLRGGISGLGLLDVWIAASLVRRRPAGASA